MRIQDRLTTSWKVTGAKSFRLASSKWLNFYGANLQNSSPSVLSCVIPEPGYVFGQPDQGGAEALIVAYEAPDGKFRELFKLGIKPHSYMALQLFPEKFVKLEEIVDYKFLPPRFLAEKPEWKDMAKKIKNSGVPYDLGKRVIHCLTPEHEVLTQDGWVFLDAIAPDTAIAVWDNDKITFEVPSKWNHGHYEGIIHEYTEPQLSQRVTENHKLPVYANNCIQTLSSTQARCYKGGAIPTAGFYSGPTFIPTEHAQLVAALQADGCILDSHTAKFRFVKRRKIKRLRELIEGYDYREIRDANDVWNCTIYDFHDIIQYFQGRKVFGSWLLRWDGAALDTLIAELQHWDGSFTEEYCHKREVFFTSIRENAEWVKTILHLRGLRGSIFCNAKGHYQVGISNRKYARFDSANQVTYNGLVICPTVATGWFLVRHNGKISVTGNSKNYDMGPRTFQINCLEISEGSITLSFAEAKAFLKLHEELFPEILQWHANIKDALFKTRTLRNLFGYPRQFNYLWSDSFLKDAYSWIPQSTVGCITHLAYREFWDYIVKHRLPWVLLNNKHDSFLFEVPDTAEHREHSGKVARQVMERHLTSTTGIPYQMKSGLSWGYNWAKYDESSNPTGMKEE